MSIPTTQVHEWSRDKFLISTDPAMIPLESLNDALGSDHLFWAKRVSDQEIKVLVDSSVCFGVYQVHDNPAGQTKQPLVGFARLVTDKVTFAYLTDVYVLPEWEGRGLGSWTIDCVKEWLALMPNLRQFTLIAGGGKDKYYARKLGTSKIEDLSSNAGIYVATGPAGSFN